MNTDINLILPKVINPTSRTFTSDEIKILSKIFKFCSSLISSNNNELKSDILEYCRWLRLNGRYFSEQL